MRHVIRWGLFILIIYLMVGLGMEADKEFLLPHPVSLPFVVGFLEAQYLAEHIGKPNNMNFNQNSVGFASGDLHPNKSKKQRERLRTNNPGMRPEHKEMMRGESNPAKNIEVRQQISQRMTGKNNPMYRAEVIAARSGDNHPSRKDPTIGSKISLARTGIKLERVICEHCQKSVAINHYPARHKNKCKGVTQP